MRISTTMVRAAVALPAVLFAAAPAAAQPRGIKADVTTLVERAIHPGEIARLAIEVRLPEGMHVQSDAPRDPSLIPTVLTLDPVAGTTLNEVVYPESTELRQTGIEQPLAVFEREFVIGAAVALAPDTPTGIVRLPGRLRYQACNDRMCFAPATAAFEWSVHVVPAEESTAANTNPLFGRIPFGRGQRPAAPARSTPSMAAAARAPSGEVGLLDAFELAGTTGGYLPRDEFLQFVRDSEHGIVPRGWFEGRGPLAILLLVLLGGIALNLTPCVLPMIPINLAIIGAGSTATTRSRGFWLGTAYGGAMAVVYGLLGLVVVTTAGTFGTINASPWFNLAIAVIFVVLALAMFDVIAIDFSRFSNRINPAGGRGTLVVAFSMGGIAALLAGACVAPVVIQVVLFASDLYAAGTTIALALPFVLGLGMALPWPIAGAGIASLPKPGAWMVRVKQAFGVLIFATAAYYGYEAYSLFANRFVDPSEVRSSVAQQVKAGWHASLDDGLAVAGREGRPVLIDFWATWCKNCLTMDRTTLADGEVKRALDGYVKVKFQAEDPSAEPARSLMQRFNAVGLPTYVILQPKSAAPRAVGRK